VGMNRWASRAGAYAALVTDTSPPLRLDMGGGEPAPTSASTDAIGPKTAAELA
jgi:hypothetical protein